MTFAEVYLLIGAIVRKLPCSENEGHVQPLLHETTIYKLVARKSPYVQLYHAEPENIPRSTDPIDTQAQFHREQLVDLEIDTRYGVPEPRISGRKLSVWWQYHYRVLEGKHIFIKGNPDTTHDSRERCLEQKGIDNTNILLIGFLLAGTL